MMNAAFSALELDWRYVKLPVPPELFAETVRALPGSGYRGANVTIPHKLRACELADERSPDAAAIGAANTLIFHDGRRVLADNTDAAGLLDALGEPLPSGALVLGAGGSARAAAWALHGAGRGRRGLEPQPRAGGGARRRPRRAACPSSQSGPS